MTASRSLKKRVLALFAWFARSRGKSVRLTKLLLKSISVLSRVGVAFDLNPKLIRINVSTPYSHYKLAASWRLTFPFLHCALFDPTVPIACRMECRCLPYLRLVAVSQARRAMVGLLIYLGLSTTRVQTCPKLAPYFSELAGLKKSDPNLTLSLCNDSMSIYLIRPVHFMHDAPRQAHGVLVQFISRAAVAHRSRTSIEFIYLRTTLQIDLLSSFII